MFDLELKLDESNEVNGKNDAQYQFLEQAVGPNGAGELESEAEPQTAGKNAASERQKDLLLVEVYKQAAASYGSRSEQASAAFEPIFERFWPQVHYRAMNKIGAVYADDLASETLKTVWERLNGNENVTNLAGLVRHSFEREYATLLEKLFQGRKLARHQAATGEGTGDEARVKGAQVFSLNAPAGSDNEELELIHTLNDPDANVEEAVARREMVVTLRKMIAQMPAHYRGPLICQWLLGMKIKDVAEELNMTIDQVKHNTRRGMDWLGKRMPEAADWL